jgi:hypothetical protein
MPGGFAPSFAIEAGFLVLLGVGAGIADLRPVKIVAILAAGWLIVSLVELAVWLAQSHSVLVPPVQPGAEAPEPEPAHGWPVEDEPAHLEDDAYPLRAGAGDERSDEVEAYTRVLESERKPSGEDEQ